MEEQEGGDQVGEKRKTKKERVSWKIRREGDQESEKRKRKKRERIIWKSRKEDDRKGEERGDREGEEHDQEGEESRKKKKRRKTATVKQCKFVTRKVLQYWNIFLVTERVGREWGESSDYATSLTVSSVQG